MKWLKKFLTMFLVFVLSMVNPVIGFGEEVNQQDITQKIIASNSGKTEQVFYSEGEGEVVMPVEGELYSAPIEFIGSSKVKKTNGIEYDVLLSMAFSGDDTGDSDEYTTNFVQVNDKLYILTGDEYQVEESLNTEVKQILSFELNDLIYQAGFLDKFFAISETDDSYVYTLNKAVYDRDFYSYLSDNNVDFNEIIEELVTAVFNEMEDNPYMDFTDEGIQDFKEDMKVLLEGVISYLASSIQSIDYYFDKETYEIIGMNYEIYIDGNGLADMMEELVGESTEELAGNEMYFYIESFVSDEPVEIEEPKLLEVDDSSTESY